MTPVRTTLAAGLCLCLLALPAGAAGLIFQWVPFAQSPSGQPASERFGTGSFGTLVTVDGAGGPGDSLLIADIASFEFTHQWEDAVTGETGSDSFDLADLSILTIFPLVVSADGKGFDSGSLSAANGTNVLRMSANPAVASLGDVNDSYVVDEFAQTGFLTNGWNGSGSGGWTLIPLPGAAWLMLTALAALGGLSRRR